METQTWQISDKETLYKDKTCISRIRIRAEKTLENDSDIPDEDNDVEESTIPFCLLAAKAGKGVAELLVPYSMDEED